MRRSSDGEVVCIVAAERSASADASTWRYGESPGKNYKIEGCDTLKGGVYRLEFSARKYGAAHAYGACDVCVDGDGKISVGKPQCNNGTCKSVH
jgi:hypothetical protein